MISTHPAGIALSGRSYHSPSVRHFGLPIRPGFLDRYAVRFEFVQKIRHHLDRFRSRPDGQFMPFQPNALPAASGGRTRPLHPLYNTGSRATKKGSLTRRNAPVRTASPGRLSDRAVNAIPPFRHGSRSAGSPARRSRRRSCAVKRRSAVIWPDGGGPQRFQLALRFAGLRGVGERRAQFRHRPFTPHQPR